VPRKGRLPPAGPQPKRVTPPDASANDYEDMNKAAQTPRPYHKGNVAEDLMAAAAKILKTERFEDLSVRRLAREVGVTPGNFYNHFPSLNDLLLDLAAEGFDERRRTTARIMRSSKTRAEAVRKSMVAFVDLAIENRQLFRIMFGQVPDASKYDRYREASDASFGQLVELVYGENIYDPNDIPASHERCAVAYGVFALAYGLALTVVEGQLEFHGAKRAEIHRFVEHVVGSFFDGSAVEVLKEKA
jgi:AcrR family transcriptional regulator